jgi:hypothetical protein
MTGIEPAYSAWEAISRAERPFLAGYTPSQVVLVMSGVVDGIADRPGDAVAVVVQPALGALALKFAPGRDGEPFEEDVGLSDAVI